MCRLIQIEVFVIVTLLKTVLCYLFTFKHNVHTPLSFSLIEMTFDRFAPIRYSVSIEWTAVVPLNKIPLQRSVRRT